MTVWVELGNADVAQVAQGADAFRQAVQQLGLLQQRDVSGLTWDTVLHIHNGAGYFIDRNLAFQSVLLLLTAVVRIGFARVRGRCTRCSK